MYRTSGKSLAGSFIVLLELGYFSSYPEKADSSQIQPGDFFAGFVKESSDSAAVAELSAEYFATSDKTISLPEHFFSNPCVFFSFR